MCIISSMVTDRETSLFLLKRETLNGADIPVELRGIWQPAASQRLFNLAVLNRKELMSIKAELGSAESSCARRTALKRAAVVLGFHLSIYR